MEMHAMTVTNFRGLKTANIRPKKLNFITGPSGSGKSSLMEAIRYAFTGKQIPDQVNLTSVSSDVTVDFENIGILERQVNRDGKTKIRLNGKTTTAKSVNEQIAAVFGFRPADANILTSSEVLEHTLGKDLAEYLLNSGFLKNDMPFSRLLALNPLEETIACELEKSLFPGLDLPRSQKMVTLELIEAAYQQYRASRPSIKRMLAEEQTKATISDGVSSRPAKQVANDISNVQMEIAVEKRKASEYPKALKDAELLKRNIEAATQEAAKYDKVKPVTEREKSLANANLANAQKLVNNTKVAIASAHDAIKPLEKTLSLLSTSMCPISSQLICTTDKTGVKSELEASLQMQKDTIEMLTEKLKEYQENVQTAQAAVDSCIKQENAYQLKLNALKHLSQLKSVSVTIPEKPNPSVVEEMKIKLNKLKTEYETAVQSEMMAEHAKRAEALKQQLFIAETLISELAPNGGIRKLVLTHSIGPMEDVCNEYMGKVLPKYKLHFNTEDNFNIVLESNEGRVSYDGISQGEQLRVLFVIMLMLNQLNQARVILLDNLNDLDVDSLSSFVSMLESVDQNDYDHLYLSGINHKGFMNIFKACKLPHTIYECASGNVTLVKES